MLQKNMDCFSGVVLALKEKPDKELISHTENMQFFAVFIALIIIFDDINS